MGPRAGLDRCGKSRPHRDSIPERPARSSVAISTELPCPCTVRDTELKILVIPFDGSSEYDGSANSAVSSCPKPVYCLT